MAKELKWARDFFSAYNPLYARYEKYYDGDHDQPLTDEVRNIFARLFKGMRNNLCPNVVDTLADRLILQGFTAETNDKAAEAFIADLWGTRRMQSRADVVHSDAIKRGDAYVVVWPGADGKPTIFPQSRGVMAVRYEDNGDEEAIAEAVKCWTTGTADGMQLLRVTRYLPDHIERYQSKNATNGLPENLANLTWYGDSEPDQIIPNPYGRVPVFHFPNALRENKFAQSELKDVVPLQDGLNKTLVDMLVGCEFHGLPQRWVTGLEKFRDPVTKKEIQPFTTGADRIWQVASEAVKFGQFDPADLAQLLAVLDWLTFAIARVTRTPLHLLLLNSGDFPSGEALKTAEAPLLSKIAKRQSNWGDVWEDVITFCATVAGGQLGQVKATWEDVTPHSEKDQADVASIKVSVLGVSKPQAQRELGYDDKQIEQMVEENAEDQAKRAELAVAAFNAGPPTQFKPNTPPAPAPAGPNE